MFITLIIGLMARSGGVLVGVSRPYHRWTAAACVALPLPP